VTGASYRARREDARRRMILEAPPPAMLPQIEAIAPERAVIEENIGGYFAKGPMVSTVAAHPGKPGFAPSWPSYVLYTMLYEPTEESSSLGVDAQVMQYPSSGWARYKAMYPDVNPLTRISSPSSQNSETKSSWILRCGLGGVALCPSGGRAAQIQLLCGIPAPLGALTKSS
jgi:hypothetical protein